MSCVRKLGIHVLKDMCLPRESSHVAGNLACEAYRLREEQSTPNVWEKSAEGILAGEMSRGLPMREKVHGGLTLVKARTVARAEWLG